MYMSMYSKLFDMTTITKCCEKFIERAATKKQLQNTV